MTLLLYHKFKKIANFFILFYSFLFYGFWTSIILYKNLDYFVFFRYFLEKSPGKPGAILLTFQILSHDSILPIFCLTTYLATIGSNLIINPYFKFKSKAKKNPSDKPRGKWQSYDLSQIHTTTLRRQPRSSTQLINSGGGYSIFNFDFKYNIN